MKKTVILLLCAFLFSAALTGCSSDTADTGDTKASDTEGSGNADDSDPARTGEDTDSGDPESNTGLQNGLHHVEIDINGYGTIALELDADTAPISVTNFMALAEDGFYDGLTFHRIIDGFMIQGGDPLGNGTGGSDMNIKGEFAKNGIDNSISHKRGVISMARSGDPDSASSQFFIVHEDSTFLDGEYAAFGHVTEGMDIVDQICKDTPVQDDNGTVGTDDQPVINTVKVID